MTVNNPAGWNKEQPLSDDAAGKNLMQYDVRHTTTYSYTDPVAICQNQIHLTPRVTANQSCADFQLEITPEPVIRRCWTDTFGNEVWYISIEEPHHQFSVTARSVVGITPRTVPAPQTTPGWEQVRDTLAAADSTDLRMASQFRFESPYIQFLPAASEYAAPCFVPGRPWLEAVLDLTARIHADFTYAPASTSVTTPTRDVLQRRCGVCQDFAHLQITCLRGLGLAARYVSGYLVTEPPAGKPRLVGADASHAWLSVFCPEFGWIDVDPTNNLLPQQRHVTVGWGRDYGDVCPIQGVFTGGGKHTMSIAVDVAPIG
jgi:transglutaminase-like putative cysteine protease